MKRYWLATAVFCAGAVSSCKENNTTAPDLGFLEVNPRTVEVILPFDDFVDDVQVFGGYGSTADFNRGVVSLDFDGLNVRSLVNLEDFPTSADVQGSDGVVRRDSDLTFVGGRAVLVFDTIDGTVNFPVGVEVFDVTEEWHGPTVSWDVAVDTAGDRRLWTQPGGAANNSLGTGTFDAFVDQVDDDAAALVDTLSINFDSATVAGIVGNGGGPAGFLLAATQSGSFLNVLNMTLILRTVPSTRPDTILDLFVAAEDLNFIVDAVPPTPVGWLRVGGAPSWRSIISMKLPRTIDGTAEVCGVVDCQVDLTEVDVNLAELVLTTRQTETGFQPRDTTGMEIRRVLKPQLLPKSPLGERLLTVTEILPPAFFSAQAGTSVSVLMTDFVTAVLGIAAVTDTVPDVSLALFSIPEPNQIGFASFEGPGGAGAPALRLLFTVANDVGLP